MKRTGPTNVHLARLISKLKELSAKENSPMWKRVATDLEKPTRARRVVNLSKINRYSDENDLIVVPGKVLSGGLLEKKLTIIAWAFSESAIKKIEASHSKALTLSEFVKLDKKDMKGAKIIG